MNESKETSENSVALDSLAVEPWPPAIDIRRPSSSAVIMPKLQENEQEDTERQVGVKESHDKDVSAKVSTKTDSAKQSKESSLVFPLTPARSNSSHAPSLQEALIQSEQKSNLKESPLENIQEVHKLESKESRTLIDGTQSGTAFLANLNKKHKQKSNKNKSSPENREKRVSKALELSGEADTEDFSLYDDAIEEIGLRLEQAATEAVRMKTKGELHSWHGNVKPSKHSEYNNGKIEVGITKTEQSVQVSASEISCTAAEMDSLPKEPGKAVTSYVHWLLGKVFSYQSKLFNQIIKGNKSGRLEEKQDESMLKSMDSNEDFSELVNRIVCSSKPLDKCVPKQNHSTQTESSKLNSHSLYYQSGDGDDDLRIHLFIHKCPVDVKDNIHEKDVKITYRMGHHGHTLEKEVVLVGNDLSATLAEGPILLDNPLASELTSHPADDTTKKGHSVKPACTENELDAKLDKHHSMQLSDGHLYDRRTEIAVSPSEFTAWGKRKSVEKNKYPNQALEREGSSGNLLKSESSRSDSSLNKRENIRHPCESRSRSSGYVQIESNGASFDEENAISQIVKDQDSLQLRTSDSVLWNILQTEYHQIYNQRRPLNESVKFLIECRPLTLKMTPTDRYMFAYVLNLRENELAEEQRIQLMHPTSNRKTVAEDHVKHSTGIATKSQRRTPEFFAGNTNAVIEKNKKPPEYYTGATNIPENCNKASTFTTQVMNTVTGSCNKQPACCTGVMNILPENRRKTPVCTVRPVSAVSETRTRIPDVITGTMEYVAQEGHGFSKCLNVSPSETEFNPISYFFDS